MIMGGELMAAAPNIEPRTAKGIETSLAPVRSRFEQMFGRMNGSMKVAGDIVEPISEVWECEHE
jgi:hypothetical protein